MTPAARAIFLVLIIFLFLSTVARTAGVPKYSLLDLRSVRPILTTIPQERNDLEVSKSSFDSHGLRNSKGAPFCGFIFPEALRDRPTPMDWKEEWAFCSKHSTITSPV
jgi:hypothetical protein